MAGQRLPEYERQVGAEPTAQPNVQGAFQQYASDTNTLGAIGAKVAQVASTALASELGAQAGKNPHGDLTPALTDFDKTFAESYVTQAQSTLGLQANKLIADSNLEITKAPRITPELISRTHQQVSQGLQKIYSLAPAAVRSKMESQYSNLQLNLTQQLTERMVREQRQDQKDTLLTAGQTNSENAYTLEMNGTNLNKDGDSQPALDAVNSTIASANANIKSHIISKQQGKILIDGANISRLTGKYVRLGQQALKDKKLPEFLKNLSEKSKDIPDVYHDDVVNGVYKHFVQQQNLVNQDENLHVAKFNTSIIQDVNGITGEQIADLKANVSPIKYQEAMTRYYFRLGKSTSLTNGVNRLNANFNNKEVYANSTPEVINKSFYDHVQQHMTNMQKDGTPISQDEAEAQIASIAAGPIPVFIKTLNLKLQSANPIDLETAGRQVDFINSSNKGQNIIGISDKSKAMYGLYQTLRESHPHLEAATIAHQTVFNQTTELQKYIQDQWTSKLKQIQHDGEFNTYFQLTNGFHHSYIPFKSQGESLIFDHAAFINQFRTKLHAYFNYTGCDMNTAQNLAANDINSMYDYSHVNGTKEYAFNPLEKYLNMPDSGLPIVQQDIIRQLSKSLESTKQLYDEGKLDWYWYANPLKQLDAKKVNASYQDMLVAGVPLQKQSFEKTPLKEYPLETQPMSVTKIFKDGHREEYPLIVQADAWNENSGNNNQWHYMIKTDSGAIPLSQTNPMLGFATYIPNSFILQTENFVAHHLRK